ncbi:MAG: hypothetical protein KF780_04960 [Sphingomonas sp.]|nr:hypothetical protein [Sphingomonas sp.]
MADTRRWRGVLTAMAATPLLAGCVSGGGTGPDTASVTGTRIAAPDPGWRTLLDGAASQVRRCYRGPRVGHAGRQIITRLRVMVTPDGLIDGRPVVIAQDGITPLNRLYAERMADAAIQSVLRCAPLSVPPGFAGSGPIEFDLTFAPLASA